MLYLSSVLAMGHGSICGPMSSLFSSLLPRFLRATILMRFLEFNWQPDHSLGHWPASPILDFSSQHLHPISVSPPLAGGCSAVAFTLRLFEGRPGPSCQRPVELWHGLPGRACLPGWVYEYRHGADGRVRRRSAQGQVWGLLYSGEQRALHFGAEAEIN